MKEGLHELYKYRELLYMLAYRDVKVRYKQSVMGLLWAILMPVLIVMAGIVVRYAYALASGKPLQTADIVSLAVRSLPEQVPSAGVWATIPAGWFNNRSGVSACLI